MDVRNTRRKNFPNVRSSSRDTSGAKSLKSNGRSSNVLPLWMLVGYVVNVMASMNHGDTDASAVSASLCMGSGPPRMIVQAQPPVAALSRFRTSLTMSSMHSMVLQEGCLTISREL
jgi:hypothetical protein